MSRVIKRMEPHDIRTSHRVQQLVGLGQRAEDLTCGEGNVQKEDDLKVVRKGGRGAGHVLLSVY
jgi:hypothetical protein